MTEIKNFIISYPLYEDNDYENQIYNLKEFNELVLDKTEPIPLRPGQPFKHQELQARYFSQDTLYKNGILWHGLGTGKTCTASLIVERFKSMTVDENPIKQAVIVVKNNSLADSFRNEISKVCTHKVYVPKIKEGEEISNEAKYRRLKIALSKTYEIVTIHDFIREKASKYSNRVIIIDEAHSIRIQEYKGGETFEESQYYKLHTLLTQLKNSRILLLTATPIWDKVHDIASLLNLILPEDDQLPVLNKFQSEFFKDGKLHKKGKQKLKQLLKGKISYIRSLEDSAKKTYKGVKDPWVKTVNIYPSELSDYQYTFAKFNEKENKDAFMTKIRDTTACVYPVINKDGSIKNNEIMEDIEKMDRLPPALVKYFKVESNLHKCSAKFHTIINILKDKPKEKAFIFNEFVNGSGGLLSLARILELYGFTWIKTASSNIPKKVVNKNNPGSFIVLSSEEGTIRESSQIRKILNIYNTDDNKYGERIRIILGSQSVSQGYTFKSTRQGHILSPHWNFSSIDQAMGRIYRAGSFNQLPENERHVTFYRHAAVVKDSDENTVDTYIYKIAEEKELLNSQMHRLMKEIAWDCAFAYKRNVLPLDADYSRDCDLDKCNYICSGREMYIDTETGEFFKNKSQGRIYKYKTPGGVNDNNYNILYSQKDITEYIAKIKELFTNYFNISFDLILQLLNIAEDKKYIILFSLDYIISNNIGIKNIYGYDSFLKEENNIYFLDSTRSMKSEYINSVYTKFPILVDHVPTDKIVEVLNLKSDIDINKIKTFVDSPTNDNYSNLSNSTQILLFEYIFKQVYTESIDLDISNNIKLVNTVWNFFNNKVYKMSDGNLTHNLYNTLYSDTDYVETKDLKPNGKLRVFIKDLSDWYNVDNRNEEMYIIEIKEFIKDSKEVLTQNNIGGKIDGDKFLIFDNRITSSKSGRNCNTLNVPELIDLISHLDILPDEKYINKTIPMDKNTLLKEIESKDKLNDKLRTRVDNGDIDDLKKIYILLKMRKNELCKFLEYTFTLKKLINIS